MSVTNLTCAQCMRQGAPLLCMACRTAAYCNAECQREHWTSEHRSTCSANEESARNSATTTSTALIRGLIIDEATSAETLDAARSVYQAAVAALELLAEVRDDALTAQQIVSRVALATQHMQRISTVLEPMARRERAEHMLALKRLPDKQRVGGYYVDAPAYMFELIYNAVRTDQWHENITFAVDAANQDEAFVPRAQPGVPHERWQPLVANASVTSGAELKRHLATLIDKANSEVNAVYTYRLDRGGGGADDGVVRMYRHNNDAGIDEVIEFSRPTQFIGLGGPVIWRVKRSSGNEPTTPPLDGDAPPLVAPPPLSSAAAAAAAAAASPPKVIVEAVPPSSVLGNTVVRAHDTTPLPSTHSLRRPVRVPRQPISARRKARGSEPVNESVRYLPVGSPVFAERIVRDIVNSGVYRSDATFVIDTRSAAINSLGTVIDKENPYGALTRVMAIGDVDEMGAFLRRYFERLKDTKFVRYILTTPSVLRISIKHIPANKAHISETAILHNPQIVKSAAGWRYAFWMLRYEM